MGHMILLFLLLDLLAFDFKNIKQLAFFCLETGRLKSFCQITISKLHAPHLMLFGLHLIKYCLTHIIPSKTRLQIEQCHLSQEEHVS